MTAGHNGGDHSDAELGMDRPITRRDFFDGVAVAAAGVAAGGLLAGCGGSSYSPPIGHGTPPDGWQADGIGSRAYPPAMTGLRGSTDLTMHIPHGVRDGSFWTDAPSAKSTGEHYDLIVVGAGISGLSAAYFYQKQHPGAKILVLDNHDDFGGHARRNEFHTGGKLLIGYGGSQDIDTPSRFSPVAKGLLAELGIELKKFETFYDQDFNTRWKLNDSEFFVRELFGSDHLAVMNADGEQTVQSLANAPMADQAKREWLGLDAKPVDYYPGLGDAEKKARLTEITYLEYLRDVVKVHPDVLTYAQTLSCDEWGYGITGFGAIDAWATDYPGFAGLKLDKSKPYRNCIPTVQLQWDAPDEYIYHFPDGNNGICKLILGRLIPGIGAPRTMEAEPLARIDYAGLDLPRNNVRVRLNSPVVKVRHVGDPYQATTVEVTYAKDGKVFTATAGGTVLACYSTMIPFIAPEFPQAQRDAMSFGTKVPVVYAMVQLSNWRAWQRLGIYHTRFTGGDWCVAELDYPVSMGGYEFSKDPDQPIAVHMIQMPTKPYKNIRGGIIEGRKDLYLRSFGYLERTLRDQLTRLLGPGGFDPARDIQAITINRWGHGYALEYGRPWATFWPDGPLPFEMGRRPLNRITVANSDSQGRAYADAAIDAAHRAVTELPV
jgi:spermidine dehydrogenase